MKKNYVLDTNILIHDPESLYKFEDNDIYIPHPVIEELDSFKKERTERGYSARQAIRNIISLRGRGNLSKGITLPNSGKLWVFNSKIDYERLPDGWESDKQDNRILLSVLTLKGKNILVTNDCNMILKADILGIPVQEYKNDRVPADHEVYTGKSTRHIDDSFINKFFADGEIPVPDTDEFKELTENEFINLISWEGKSALCKYQKGTLKKLRIHKNNPRPYGLEPRNMSQQFLMDALLSPPEEQPLTIVNGPAGTGKTLFAIGCGLEQVTEASLYKRILVCRANVTMDEELGFLPGGEKEKIDPLFRGVYDNLAVLLENKDDTRDTLRGKIQYLFDHDYIVTESLAYLRGRSICNTYIMIDEAQNCTPNQIMSIITRAGEGTKIVLLGDINQIDNPRLDRGNNGLVYALERMKVSNLCDVCSFTEAESTRSPLAKEAAERLKRR